MTSQEIFGRELDEYPLNEKYEIPDILIILTTYFFAREEMIETEGIFRVPASKGELKKLGNAILQGNFEYVFNIQDPHLIAGGIKKFFRKLKTPLFPFEAYQEFTKFNGKNASQSLFLTRFSFDF